MTTCWHCEKQLNVGDEVHLVDNMPFCSKECAILYLAHEIAMNAKAMAIEQYNDSATILTKRVDFDHATCCDCGKDLAKCDVIYAAEGRLYCSRECGMRHYSNVESDPAQCEILFDSLAEEITPTEIGLAPYEDEKPDYMTKDQCMQAIQELAKSQGFYQRLLDDLMDDAEHRDLVLNDLEEQHFKDIVDMVLWLES
jgi:endogenous inhibitor of DNA gyrase (YacG/DUF329 family)